LIRLTGDLLDIARMESGNIVLEKRSIRCSDVIDQAMAAIRPLADAKGITLTTTPNDLTLTADADRVNQILINFLSNAVKYSDSNTSVEVLASESDAAVQFSVVDQGRGIPSDLVPSVFDRFKQVKNEDAKDGAGLGLAICKLLAEAHQGSVGVDTSLGMGSNFWLRLPIS